MFLSQIFRFLMTFVLLLGTGLTFSGCDDDADTKKPPVSTLEIITEPAGADIFIKREHKGKTPLTLELTPKQPVIVATVLPGHRRALNVAKMSNDKNTLRIKLEPITSIALIRTQPAGARLVIDGRAAGTTPCILQDLTPGDHALTLNSPGHDPQKITLSVPQDGSPIWLSLNLSSNMGTLVLNSMPAEAMVKINGITTGTTPFKAEMLSGEYEVSIHKDGFTALSQNLIVTRGKITTAQFNLIELPGQLTVVSNRPNTRITVDEADHGIAPVELKNLAPGKYAVTASAEGFDSETRTIEVTRGGTSSVEFALEPNTGIIEVTANNGGISVYVDGQFKGITQFDPEESGFNNRTVLPLRIENIAAGTHEVRCFNAAGNPQSVTRTVTLKKGETSTPERVEMWVPNVKLYLVDEEKALEGYLKNQTASEIYFQPSRGITRRYTHDAIRKIVPIDYAAISAGATKE